jgi:hypothetical protein
MRDACGPLSLTSPDSVRILPDMFTTWFARTISRRRADRIGPGWSSASRWARPFSRLRHCRGTVLGHRRRTSGCGTIEGGPFAGAVLDEPGSGQTFFRLNQTLPNGSRIMKVFDDHILPRSSDGAGLELYTTSGDGGATALPRPETAAYQRPDGGARISDEGNGVRHFGSPSARTSPPSPVGKDKAARDAPDTR